MSGAVTAIAVGTGAAALGAGAATAVALGAGAGAVSANQAKKAAKSAAAQPAAAAPAPTAAQPAPQPVVAPAPAEPPAPVYNTVMRDAAAENSKQAQSPQARRIGRGGGASGSTMLTGGRANVGTGDLGGTSLLGQ